MAQNFMTRSRQILRIRVILGFIASFAIVDSSLSGDAMLPWRANEIEISKGVAE
jgi:hypothetical protein